MSPKARAGGRGADKGEERCCSFWRVLRVTAVAVVAVALVALISKIANESLREDLDRLVEEMRESRFQAWQVRVV